MLGVIERLKKLRSNVLMKILIQSMSNESLINMVLPKLPLKQEEMIFIANYLEKVSAEVGKPLSEIILSDDFFEIIESIIGMFESKDSIVPQGPVIGTDTSTYNGDYDEKIS